MFAPPQKAFCHLCRASVSAATWGLKSTGQVWVRMEDVSVLCESAHICPCDWKMKYFPSALTTCRNIRRDGLCQPAQQLMRVRTVRSNLPQEMRADFGSGDPVLRKIRSAESSRFPSGDQTMSVTRDPLIPEKFARLGSVGFCQEDIARAGVSHHLAVGRPCAILPMALPAGAEILPCTGSSRTARLRGSSVPSKTRNCEPSGDRETGTMLRDRHGYTDLLVRLRSESRQHPVRRN